MPLASLHQFISCSSMALACLSPLSICLDSSVPARGWLDPWHKAEFPNDARGLRGQAAQPSQRHLSYEEGLLPGSQCDFTLDYTCRNQISQPKDPDLKTKMRNSHRACIWKMELIVHSGLGSGGLVLGIHNPRNQGRAMCKVWCIEAMGAPGWGEGAWQTQNPWENSICVPRKQGQRFSVHCVLLGSSGGKMNHNRERIAKPRTQDVAMPISGKQANGQASARAVPRKCSLFQLR